MIRKWMPSEAVIYTKLISWIQSQAYREKFMSQQNYEDWRYLKRSTMMASIIMEDEFPTARKTGSVVAQGDNAGTRTKPATAILSIGWLWA